MVWTLRGLLKVHSGPAVYFHEALKIGLARPFNRRKARRPLWAPGFPAPLFHQRIAPKRRGDKPRIFSLYLARARVALRLRCGRYIRLPIAGPWRFYNPVS
jgi:hypothetical protein